MVQLEGAGAHGLGVQQACSHRRLAVCALAVATMAAVVAGSGRLLGGPALRPDALELPAAGGGRSGIRALGQGRDGMGRCLRQGAQWAGAWQCQTMAQIVNYLEILIPSPR